MYDKQKYEQAKRPKNRSLRPVDVNTFPGYGSTREKTIVSNFEPLRVGIIGCGFFATNHLHSWLGIPGAKIVALCDSNPDRLAAASKLVGPDVRTFSKASELYATAMCDFVDIITPPSTHHDLVLEAARMGMPAIVQKPMDLTAAGAAEMVDAMAAAGLPFMVHENFRFQGPIAEVRRLMDTGRIGRPIYGRIVFRTGFDIYGNQPYLAREKRFVLADVGVHVLDVARFLFGEVERLTCEASSVKPGIAGEDMATVLSRHAGGAVSIAECSYASLLPNDSFPQCLVTVEGTGGGIVLGPDYTLSIRSGDQEEGWNAEPPRLNWAELPWQVVQDSVRATQVHWVDSFRAGRQPATSGRDNLKTIKLVEAAYRSIETKATVEL